MDENPNSPKQSAGDKVWAGLVATSRYLLIFYLIVAIIWATALLVGWLAGSQPE